MLGWYRHLPYSRREEIAGFLFITPWLIGFLIFQLGAMAIAFGLSFFKVDPLALAESRFVGLQNYQDLLADDLVWIALKNTAIYAIGRMPFVIALGLAIALLLNRERFGVRALRTLYYLPAVTTGVAVALLWHWILNPDYGLLNAGLAMLGIRGPRWLYSEEWALPSLMLISLWGVGQAMLIYLAGLRGVPQELYEAAAIDGAGPLRQFIAITLPMISPAIFYSLVVGIIGSFQVFLNAYILTAGGPNNATLTMVLYIYRKAFQEFYFGYGAAVAWVLFMLILAFTLLIFRSSAVWVYYEGELRKAGRTG
jgi:multiple sugar transport system permease protein